MPMLDITAVKASAILFSSFEEVRDRRMACCLSRAFRPRALTDLPLCLRPPIQVLYLDADCVPLQDPTHLFENRSYNEVSFPPNRRPLRALRASGRRPSLASWAASALPFLPFYSAPCHAHLPHQTGALFWRDMWPPSVAPDLYEVVGLPRASGRLTFPHAHAEAQLLVHKGKRWKPCLLSLFFNLQARERGGASSRAADRKRKRAPRAGAGRLSHGTLPLFCSLVSATSPLPDVSHPPPIPLHCASRPCTTVSSPISSARHVFSLPSLGESAWR